MDESFSDRPVIVPTASLPDGWKWQHWGDGSGGLHAPDGTEVIRYDRATYHNVGWVEYYHNGSWSVYQDTFNDFIAFAESLVHGENFGAKESGESVGIPIILELNDFANRCGYFHNAYLTDSVTLNNGYNCRHPAQEEAGEINGKTFGCCYRFSCPLAYQADVSDLIRYGVVDDGTEAVDDDYMIVSDEKTIKDLRAAGVTGLAGKGEV